MVNSARYSDGSLSESEDIYMTINKDHGPEFYGVEPPKAQQQPRVTKESSQNERQISVDPISLQGSTAIRHASFRLVSPPEGSGTNPNPSPSPTGRSPPSKLNFVTSSLPSSATSSPHSTNFLKKMWKSQHDHNKSSSRGNLSRVGSTMDDTHLAMAETTQKRSRSLNEGRRSSTHTDDFDLVLEKKSNPGLGGRAPSKPPLGPSSSDMRRVKSRDQNYLDDGFNCGKLCLFLPRGKGKPVRSISEVSTQISIPRDAPVMSTTNSGVSTQVSNTRDAPVISRTISEVLSQGSDTRNAPPVISRTISGVSTQGSSVPNDPSTISRRVSLERFECGSWASSLHEDAEGDSTNLFFDLPMEMLRCSVSDIQSPVTAAFVFENEDDDDKDQAINVEMEPDVQRRDLDAFLEKQS